MAEKVVSVRLQARVEGFTAGMTKAKKSVDDLTKAAAPSKADAFGKLADKAALAGVGVATAVGVAVKRFADFDQAMSAVQANSGATGKSLDALRDAAVKMGADSQFSATEAAQGINEMAKAGVEAKDILGGGLKGALDLAAAGQISVADAAQTAATAMTQFGLSGEKVPHIADLLANAANKAQGGVGDMAQALNQAGLVANAMGLSIEETTAGLTAFASAGLLGSDAGTAFKTMLQRLAAPTGEAQKQMKALNINAYDAQGQFVGLANVAEQLKTGMEDLTPAQRNAALSVIFGSDAVRAANVLYDQGAAGINKWTDAVSEQGAAAKQAAALTDNLKGDIERLGGALDSVFINTGSSANGSLRGLTQGITGLVNKIGEVPGPILLAGGALASFALLAPKGVIKYREYVAQLDSLGLSMDKISAKSPRTAKALGTVGTAAKGLAVAATAAAVLGKDMGELGTAQLQSDLLNSKDAADSLDAAINHLNKSGFGEGATNVRSFGDVLRYSFDPGFMSEAAHSAEGVLGVFGVTQTNDISVASDRLREIDATLSAMAQSGAGAQAASLFEEFTKQAAAQGVTVDQLKAKFPGYQEALAGIANAASATVQPQEDMAEATDAVQQSADEAQKALSDLRTAIEGLGSPAAKQRAAEREFQSAIDDATASIKENGKSLDEHNAKGRANQAALDSIAAATREKVAADFEATNAAKGTAAATTAATAAMQKGRDAFLLAADAAGLAEPEAKKLADSLGLIPKDVQILVSQSGAAAAEEAIDQAARDRTTIITVKRRIADIKAQQASDAGAYDPDGKADGGRINGYSPHARADNILIKATAGEFMIRKAAADSLGKATLDYLNRYGRLPERHADGGVVGSAQFAPLRLAPSLTVSRGGSDGFGRMAMTGSLSVDGLNARITAVASDLLDQRDRNKNLRRVG